MGTDSALPSAASATKGRRGRPPAEPRPARDEGTDQLKAKREALVGIATPELAAYPLGVLLSRRLISIEMHGTGGIYAWLWGRVLQARTVPITVPLVPKDLQPVQRRLEDAEQERFRRMAFEELDARMTREARQAAVYHQWPACLFLEVWTDDASAELRAVQAGLHRAAMKLRAIGALL